MDGLSAAASGIAVVSLAIQLVDSVREIRRFLHSVSNAPKELERLIDLLEQLELILQQVATLIEKQQNAEFGETSTSTNVLRAIKTCESKVSMVESLIESTKQAASTSNRATRTIGSLKLACKKKDIQGFESQLHDAVNLLTLTMMANLTYIHSHSMEQLLSQVSITNQATSTISQELTLMRTGFASNREVISNETHDLVRETARSPVSRNKSTTVSTYNSLFGRLLVKRTSSTAMSSSEGLQSSPGTYTVVESSWIFIPSFLPSCVDFRYLSTCGNIQRSVRTYAVISSSHPVWDMCEKGDLKGVQKLLSGRQISPFCVNYYGETLLHRAAGYFRSEVCELLFETGLTGEEVDMDGLSTYVPRTSLVANSESILWNWERTYRLFASHLDDLNPAFLGVGPFSDWRRFDLSADLFSRMVEDFVSEENIHEFVYSPISSAMRMLWKSQPTDRDYKAWRKATRRLINLMRDDHNSSDCSGGTLLGEILNLVDRPYESSSMGCAFLDILSELNFDVVEYLRAETKHHFDPAKSLPMLPGSWDTEFRERYLVISEAPPSVSWEWFIDPEGSAYILLLELKDFALGRRYPHESENDHWPFSCSDYSKSIWLLQNGWPVSPKDETRLRICNNRFQRRQHKNALKLAKTQGILYRSHRVPGAWID